MASTTKPGPAINLEEDGGEALDGSIFLPDSEATSLLVCYSPSDDRDIDCNPYFPFSGTVSDSGSGSYADSEPDPSSCLIDFFNRESSEVDGAEYLQSSADDFNIWGFYDPKEDEEIVLGTGSVLGSGSDQQTGDSGEQGLRVTGIDSDSDYEDDVFDYTSGDSGNEENDSGRVDVFTGLPPVWDYAFGEETILAEEDWEEVQNAINWTSRTFSRSEEEEEDGEEEEEEEVYSQSRISSRGEDEEEHELDWQVLLTVNNVVNFIEQAEGIMINPEDIDPSYYLYLASLDVNDENDILGQMFDNEIEIRGNPPAAKRVVEDLPVVELTVEELNIGNTSCAVCKDEMVLEEKVRRLPCKHLYHGECIIPWLGIRNTCPVCRFELPTDDLEYERHRRSHRNNNSLFLAG